jgi:hypothetical protein
LEFNKNAARRDGRHSICRACRAEYDHERYKRVAGKNISPRPHKLEHGRTEWLRGLKEGKPCTDCGGLFAYQVLQWDHRPGLDKLGDVSADFWSRSRDAILAEIAKCDLVCTNCHAIRTFERAGWARRWMKEAGVANDPE